MIATAETMPTTPTWIMLLSLLALLAAACGEPSDGGAPADNEAVVSAPTSLPVTTTPAAGSGEADSLSIEPGLEPLVALARTDLAERLGIENAAIRVLRAESTTWRDGSLGCPQPGFSYIQVLSEGAVIELKVGSTVYSYHSGGNREPFLCEL